MYNMDQNGGFTIKQSSLLSIENRNGVLGLSHLRASIPHFQSDPYLELLEFENVYTSNRSLEELVLSWERHQALNARSEGQRGDRKICAKPPLDDPRILRFSYEGDIDRKLWPEWNGLDRNKAANFTQGE